MRKNIFTSEYSPARDLMILTAIFVISFSILCMIFSISNGVGASMLPTLSTNDYSIGLRSHKADRGDIVSLTSPEQNSVEDGIIYYSPSDYIETKSTREMLGGSSQLVGKEGDVFEIRDYQYYINGSPIETEYTASIKTAKRKIGQNERCYISPYGSAIYTPNNGHRDIIKRVVAVPGDHLVIKDSTLYINGDVVDEPYLSEENLNFEGEADIQLGDNEYYVLGDNRHVSSDSRSFGPVKDEDIESKLIFTTDHQLVFYVIVFSVIVLDAVVAYVLFMACKSRIDKAIAARK